MSLKKKTAIAASLLLLTYVFVGLDRSGRSSRAPEPNRIAGGAPPEAGETPPDHNCRFWGSIAESIPGRVIEDHLIHLPHSIDSLSRQNPNGWSVAYFADSGVVPVIARGDSAAYLDALFDTAVVRAAAAAPRVAVSHIRRCSSGLCDIPNPHPFVREKNGKRWLMGHNGAIEKSILLDLIRPEYLADNPPENGADSTEWIDSELYFLYMLQTFEEFDWQIKPALGWVVYALRERIPGTGERLNFFLTEGSTLFAYREGPTLFCRSDTSGIGCSAVASMYPTGAQEDWIEILDGRLLTMTPGSPILIEEIEDYFGATPVAERDPAPVCGTGLLLRNRPNPFNATTEIRFSLPVEGSVRLSLHDLSGRWTATLVHRRMAAGEHRAFWDGRGATGTDAASGVYFATIESAGGAVTRRIVLVR